MAQAITHTGKRESLLCRATQKKITTQLQHRSVVGFCFYEICIPTTGGVDAAQLALKNFCDERRAPGSTSNICFTLMIRGAASSCNIHEGRELAK